jgi:Tfp pilus assembly protein PilX
MLNRGRKGVALFIVLGIIMLVTVLATVILRIMSNQARLTHHQVSRIKAYYADKAGMNLVFDKLRTGTWSAPASGISYYCINAKVDVAVTCLDTVVDATIPYNVQIAVYPQNSGLNQTIKLEIKSSYTYTPS